MNKVKNILIGVLAALLALSIAIGAYFFFRGKTIEKREEKARIEAQNRIAELSETIQENEATWSRLAQEKEIEIASLREQIPELARLIEERNERIQNLTTTVGRLRRIRVVADRENVTQTTEPNEPERIRVAFDQVWEDFMRIHGFTLTSPAEAEINVDYTRPVRISVITTQQEDLSWRTYLEHDIPNLEVEVIESSVNPLPRPQNVRHWYENIMIGVGGTVGIQGQMGTAHLSVGYDAGNWDLGIILGGIFTTNGVDFAPGLEFRIAPFSL